MEDIKYAFMVKLQIFYSSLFQDFRYTPLNLGFFICCFFCYVCLVFEIFISFFNMDYYYSFYIRRIFKRFEFLLLFAYLMEDIKYAFMV